MNFKEILKYYLFISFLAIIGILVVNLSILKRFSLYELNNLFKSLLIILFINLSYFILLTNFISNKILKGIISILIFQTISYIYFEKFTHGREGYVAEYVFPWLANFFNLILSVLFYIFFITKKSAKSAGK